jgi:hypothetical protein
MPASKVLHHEVVYHRALYAAASRALPGVTLFHRNVGAIKLEQRMFRAGLPGQSDFYAIRHTDAKHFEVEVKNVGGRLSEDQERWRTWCTDHGVPSIVLEVRRGEVEPETVARWLAELKEFFGCFE